MCNYTKKQGVKKRNNVYENIRILYDRCLISSFPEISQQEVFKEAQLLCPYVEPYAHLHAENLLPHGNNYNVWRKYYKRDKTATVTGKTERMSRDLFESF
jgi:hypothetical protein